MSSDLERFWAKVDRSAGPEGCWLWTDSLHPDGYARLNAKLDDGRWQMIPAHRAVLLMTGVEPIRPELEVCHRPTCPRHCVNPSHLRFDTHAANMAERRVPKGATKNRLSESDKSAICRRHANGESVIDIARDYSVTRQNVHYILRKRGRGRAANDNGSSGDKVVTRGRTGSDERA